MELKPNYQYTYFIKPFNIKENSYSKYLTKMLKDKKFKIKMWEKERDLDMYTYFLPEIRDRIFFGFQYTKSQKDNFEKNSIKRQVNILKKQTCVHFFYDLEKDTQGKIGKENGIFFGIEKIEIVCFNTGTCFLLIKAYLEDLKDFSDVLNFNYKFREMGGEYEKLKEYEKINIQTDTFSSSEDLKRVIENLTGQKDNTQKTEDDKFYLYSYTCIDGENWNDKITFNDIKIEFWKYSNVLPSSYNIDVNFEENSKILEMWQYARFGFSKNAGVLLTSSLNSYHYTKLPYEYENQYLYTYLLALYQKVYFKKLIEYFKDGQNTLKVKKHMNRFIQQIWLKEITKDEIGSMLYEKWNKTFELDNVYLETMYAYDLAYKEQSNITSKISSYAIFLLLAFCIILNIVNLSILLR